jgi:hypothetical protein
MKFSPEALHKRRKINRWEASNYSWSRFLNAEPLSLIPYFDISEEILRLHGDGYGQLRLSYSYLFPVRRGKMCDT